MVDTLNSLKNSDKNEFEQGMGDSKKIQRGNLCAAK